MKLTTLTSLDQQRSWYLHSKLFSAIPQLTLSNRRLSSSQQIAECFDKCISRLLKAIRRQLERGSPVDVGFFAFAY
jgi:hypothetical protein